MKYLIIALLILFLIYMIVWSVKLFTHTKHQEKLSRIQELRNKRESQKTQEEEKQPEQKVTEPVTETIAKEDGRDYWLNRRELEQADSDRERERCYHYFDSVDECVKGLLFEIYDYGLVRIDELEKIAYGEDYLKSVDLSFLDDLDKEDDMKSVEELQEHQIMDAAKKLSEDDLGVTDIHGTLSKGVIDVMAAVEQEKEIEEKKQEPIVVKKEKSVEKERKNRERTSSQAIRNQIFMKWDGYVTKLYDMIEVNASEDTKHRVKKALVEYGYNDVDVLLKSPD